MGTCVSHVVVHPVRSADVTSRMVSVPDAERNHQSVSASRVLNTGYTLQRIIESGFGEFERGCFFGVVDEICSCNRVFQKPRIKFDQPSLVPQHAGIILLNSPAASGAVDVKDNFFNKPPIQ